MSAGRLFSSTTILPTAAVLEEQSRRTNGYQMGAGSCRGTKEPGFYSPSRSGRDVEVRERGQSKKTQGPT
jgi:hypothetical protein